MDETTRPPQKEDLVRLCEELNRLGAEIHRHRWIGDEQPRAGSDDRRCRPLD